MNAHGISPKAIATIRGLTDAALVAIFRSTRLTTRGGYKPLTDALADELRRRPHISFDGEFVHGFNGSDGYGSMPGRDDK